MLIQHHSYRNLFQVEGQPNILNEANKPIFEMMQGDTSDKIGGILAIGIVYICHHRKIDIRSQRCFLQQSILSISRAT